MHEERSARGVDERAVEQLERELLLGVQVLDEVHGPHAALAELPFHAIAPGEDRPRGEAFRRLVGQGVP